MSAFRPRIYQLENPVHETGPDFAAELQQAAAAGFDHVMLGGDEPAGTVLSSAFAAAASQGMSALLRLSLDNPGATSTLRTVHAEWLAARPGVDDELPDPRHAGSARPPPGLRFDNDEITTTVADWWVGRLVQLAGTPDAAGAAGFCLDVSGPATPAFFSRIISAVKAVAPSCRFMAWTPGVDGARVASLAGCGFDAAVTSSAWWDGRAGWLADEAARLQGFGSLIASSWPTGERLIGRLQETEASTGLACRERSLWLAAFTGDGLVVSREGLADMAVLAAAAGSAGVSRQHSLVRQVIDFCRFRPSGAAGWRTLSAGDAAVALILRPAASAEDESQLLALNTRDTSARADLDPLLARHDGLALTVLTWPAVAALEAGPVTLAPAETRLYAVGQSRISSTPPKDSRRAAEAAARSPRIAIEDISPCVDGGRFVAKCAVGDRLIVEADIFGEGHDRLAACVLWRAADEDAWQEAPLEPVVNDRWRTALPLARVGRYQYQVLAWIDVFGAYRNEIDKKTAAGQRVGLELREGRLMLEAALERMATEGREQLIRGLKRTLKTLAALDLETQQQEQVDLLLSDEVLDLMTRADARAFSVTSAPVLQVDAERRAAGFSSWYELFPRSMGPDAATHGTLLDVVPRLPAIQAMGFDTLYFTPIHPIGRKHRKGPNNSLETGETDPGSPYAIGSEAGGHDAIHPELGTLEDFRTLRRAADAHGLELALDFAIQCSPDHPWLTQHPDWFSWRPDGSIRYAENPPKKYQDIVNVDFYAAGAVPKLWLALRDVVLFWVEEGVKVFRVDNPHTKPMPFWEWLIGDVRARAPEVIFLAEAFTRPKPMYRLAKLGFSQSYSYFTWRHTKSEFIDYLTELTQDEPKDFFRPHFFVNTPDINPYFLQRSGRAGFVIRAALAATLSGLWGLYSGFELCEAAPVPGKEEYLDSEKYELRQRDWTQPGNIIREVTLLNQARRANRALQSHHGVRFCQSSGEDILCFTKTAPQIEGAGHSIVFVAICLDPHSAHDCSFELPFEDWGLPEGSTVSVLDLAHGNRFTLTGRHHQLRLDPNNLAFTLWQISLGSDQQGAI